jgi:YesN/AraC family two-component response regulator
MAGMTGLNAVYFGALFRRETGMTLNRYLLKTRMKNGENFSRHFKEACGISPSACIPKKNMH